jgi:hypothetical protein
MLSMVQRSSRAQQSIQASQMADMRCRPTTRSRARCASQTEWTIRSTGPSWMSPRGQDRRDLPNVFQVLQVHRVHQGHQVHGRVPRVHCLGPSRQLPMVLL